MANDMDTTEQWRRSVITPIDDWTFKLMGDPVHVLAPT